ncbi:MAG: hypothetical protein ACKV2O_25210 [Acidimicrobiales bacterium]
MTRRSLRVGASLLVSLVLAAACRTDTETPTGAVRNAAGETAEVANDDRLDVPTELPTGDVQWRTYNDVEAARAQQRINQGGWGVGAGGVLRGPDDWSVPLGACSTDAHTGLDVDTIRVAHLAPRSPGSPGSAASPGTWAVIGAAMADVVARAGPITDSMGRTRTVELVEREADDGFFAYQVLAELDQRDPVFAITQWGRSAALGVFDEANRQCLPQLVLDEHPAFGDPEHHPWTVGLGLAASTEAELWGRHIEATTPPGAKVAALVMNNDIGRAYLDGFERFVARSAHGIVLEVVTTEPAGGVWLADDVDPVADMGADVFIAMTAGTGCRTVVADAERLGLHRTVPQRWLPSGCARGAIREGGDGWLAFRATLARTTDPLTPTDPTVAAALERVRAAAGHDLSGPDVVLSLQGLLAGHVLVESLRVAGALPGGLSRPNLLLALRTMELSSPYLQPGVTLRTAGGADPFALEHAELVRYDVGAAAFAFLSGPHGLAEPAAPCHWDRDALRCR